VASIFARLRCGEQKKDSSPKRSRRQSIRRPPIASAASTNPPTPTYPTPTSSPVHVIAEIGLEVGCIRRRSHLRFLVFLGCGELGLFENDAVEQWRHCRYTSTQIGVTGTEPPRHFSNEKYPAVAKTSDRQDRCSATSTSASGHHAAPAVFWPLHIGSIPPSAVPTSSTTEVLSITGVSIANLSYICLYLWIWIWTLVCLNFNNLIWLVIINVLALVQMIWFATKQF
jgi:hypothetical protein